MNPNRFISGAMALTMLAGSTLAAPAAVPRMTAPEMPRVVLNASEECWAIGQRYAEREGGELYNASAETRGGEQVCVIVVVIRRDGQRPRRAEFVVNR